jgi:hypothetical protein
MGIQINPAALNVVHVAAAAIPSAIATALVSGGGNNYYACALFVSSILGAIAQVCHFNKTTVAVVQSIPAIVAQLSTVADNAAPVTGDAK